MVKPVWGSVEEEITMIKDYELLKNGELLLSKKLIIWGAGLKGRELAEKLRAYAAGVELVDSDKEKQDTYHGISIYAPEHITRYTRDDIAVIVSPNDPGTQECILSQISMMGYQDVDIYTRFAVEGALYFMKERLSKVENTKSEMKRTTIYNQDNIVLNAGFELLKQIFMAEMSEKSVYIYQPKKVGSVSLTYSAKAVGVYGVHVHSFSWFEQEKNFVRSMMRKSSGKVITIVREPISRQISLLWHYWGKGGTAFLQEKKLNSLEELERKYYSPDNKNEFEWYKNEFQQVLDIDIYNYPFDRDLGYSIIEQDGFQVLILKLEKMSMLEKVIGEFLEVPDFELINRNVAKRKHYRYAYQNYLENVKIPVDFWEYYYNGNDEMNHFYSEKEKKQFYKQWKSHIES